MSFRDIYLLRRLGLGMVLFTGALATLLGGWILTSAFSRPPEIILTQNEPRESVLREPSSVVGAEPHSVKIEKTDSKIETLSLGCLRDGSKVELKSAALRVRISGRLCPGLKASLPESSIVNRTNGYAATLFNLEGGGFTSDYIALADGQNSLLLEIEDAKGARSVANVHILRSFDP